MILTGLIVAALTSLTHGASAGRRYDLLDRCHPFSNICLLTIGRNVVEGAVFDRYIAIWLENIDFGAAAADRETLSSTSRDG